MIGFSCYILADVFFIARGIGADALAALNLTLPAYNLMNGIGLMIGMGGAARYSLSSTRPDSDTHRTAFTHALLLAALCALFFSFAGAFCSEEISAILGADHDTIGYASDYIRILLLFSPLFLGNNLLLCFVRNDGAPRLSMAGMLIGSLANIVLDYIFLYPMNMGMKGAALATVLGSSLTVVILCTHFFTKKNQLKFTLKGFHPSFLQKIIANGFTSFVIEAASGFTIFIFNLQLIRYLGNTGVSVYGIICNTALVVICLCKGIEQAAQPILSINHGAGLSSRILKVQSLSLKTSVIICTLPVLLGLFVPNLFTYIFLEPTSKILTLAAPAIRIYFTGFLFLGINMVFICYFQSVAKSVQSLSLCLLRGCILVVAFVYILPVFFGSTGIWLAFPAADFLTMIVGICFYRQDLKAY